MRASSSAGQFCSWLWFAAAIASTLRDAGQGGWEAAATASSAALAASVFVLITLSAALAYSIARATDGIWAPDGAYSRFIAPIITLAWTTVVSGLLFTRGRTTARAPERAAFPAL